MRTLMAVHRIRFELAIAGALLCLTVLVAMAGYAYAADPGAHWPG